MKTMKRLFLLSMALSAFWAMAPVEVQAQIPPAGDPHCVYCGVNLKTGEAHKRGCEYYSEPEREEESSSSNSTHLKDYEPLPEVRSELKMDYENYQLMYRVGDGNSMVRCPHCGEVTHKSGCELGRLQGVACQSKDRALAATTKATREAALRDYHRAEEEMRRMYESDQKRRSDEMHSQFEKREEEARMREQEVLGQHVVSANIRNEYDKKLTIAYGGVAYGKTYPNGREEWVVYSVYDYVIGVYAKVERIGNKFFKVKDSRGYYGLCDTEKEIIAPRYAGMDAIYDSGSEYLYLDVTERGTDGLLKHGLLNPISEEHSSVLPCEYDRIEVISGHYRFKVTKNGRMGVVDDKGDVVVEPKYEYLNTYFVKTGSGKYTRMFFIVGNGGRFGAWDDNVRHYQWNQEMEVPMEYTVDQVKSMLEKRYK